MDKATLLAALKAALEAQNLEAIEQLALKALDEYEQEAFPYFFLGEANLLKEKYANTELCLAKAIEIDPKNSAYKLRLASVKEMQYQFDDAMLLYQNIFNEDEDNLQALMGLSRYFAEIAEEEEEALEYINKALVIAPKNALLYTLRAKAFLLFSKLEEALKDIEQSLFLAPTPAALLLKIKLLSEQNATTEMTRSYEQLIAIDPENPFYKMNFASHLMVTKDFERAAVQLEAVIAADKAAGQENTDCLELLAVAYTEQGKQAEALVLFNDLIGKDDKNWTLYTKRATVYLAMENKEAALADFTTAEQYVSAASKPELQQQKANLLIVLESYDAAIKVLIPLEKEETYAKEARFLLGKAYHSKGEMDSAYAYLQQASNQRHAEAKAYLERHFFV